MMSSNNITTRVQKFERGNKQNTFTSLEKHNGDVNLKLQLTNDCVYISTSEALAIINMHRYALQGMSTIGTTDDEFMLRAEDIAYYFNKNNMLKKSK